MYCLKLIDSEFSWIQYYLYIYYCWLRRTSVPCFLLVFYYTFCMSPSQNRCFSVSRARDWVVVVSFFFAYFFFAVARNVFFRSFFALPIGTAPRLCRSFCALPAHFSKSCARPSLSNLDLGLHARPDPSSSRCVRITSVPSLSIFFMFCRVSAFFWIPSPLRTRFTFFDRGSLASPFFVVVACFL